MQSSQQHARGPKPAGEALRYPPLGPWHKGLRRSVREMADRIVASRPEGWFQDAHMPTIVILAEAVVDQQRLSAWLFHLDPGDHRFGPISARESKLAKRVEQLSSRLRLYPAEDQLKRLARASLPRAHIAAVSDIKTPRKKAWLE